MTHYYYSDVINSKLCRDTLIDEIIIRPNHQADNNDETESPAPNLTVYDSIESAKWNDLLKPESPIIRFWYQDGNTELDPEKAQVTYHFNLDRELEELILLSDFDPSVTNEIFSFAKLVVNDVETSTYQFVEKPMPDLIVSLDPPVPNVLRFLRVPGHRKKGELAIGFVYENSEDAEDKNYWWSANALKIASDFFDPREIGLFQGANPSLTEGWRSSYVSIMGKDNYGFDKVEERAIERAISQYGKKSAVQARPSN
jgi:hypothetical protein